MQRVKALKNVLQISKFTENIREHLRMFPISIAPLNGLRLWLKIFCRKLARDQLKVNTSNLRINQSRNFFVLKESNEAATSSIYSRVKTERVFTCNWKSKDH